MNRRITHMFAATGLAMCLSGATHAAIITSTGPTYTYSYDVAAQGVVDPNLTVTPNPESPKVQGDGYTDNGSFSGNGDYILTYILADSIPKRNTG